MNRKRFHNICLGQALLNYRPLAHLKNVGDLRWNVGPSNAERSLSGHLLTPNRRVHGPIQSLPIQF